MRNFREAIELFKRDVPKVTDILRGIIIDAEKFNTYRFADYKEQVIDLLKRVCTASIQTMQLIKKMESKQIRQ